MICFCEECGNSYNIDPEKIKEDECSFNCLNCNVIIVVSPSQKHLEKPVFDDLLPNKSQDQPSQRQVKNPDSAKSH